MFFFGQFVSSSLCAKIRCTVDDGFQRLADFVISLDSTILLSSFTISGPIHTEEGDEDEKAVEENRARTLFPNQTVVTVVGVVSITQTSMTVFEFEEFVAVLS